MKRNTKHEGRSPKRLGALLLLLLPAALFAEELSTLCADRTAIEQVYYNHRLGQKPPFEQVSPPSLIERLVKEEALKEAALRNVYGVQITAAMLDAEVKRVNTTTRAPEMLAEIKAALGNDPETFANAFAKPFLVEHLLRDKFENDDALHAPRRREAEKVREQLLAARSSRGHEAQAFNAHPSTLNSQPDQSLLTSAAPNSLIEQLLALLKGDHSNGVSEATWQLTPRPAETNAPTSDEVEIKKRFGPDAQVLSSPHGGGKEQRFYFADLPVELQRVLRVQLLQPGDVSAVIETPGGFLLYVCKETTAETLSAAVLSLPKRSYEQWLNEQSGGAK